jgi:predicted PolB exonuclease-like 3'-5' exonuclease
LTPILVFDLETIPDVAGIRRLGLAPQGLDDRATVLHLQAERAAKGQASFCRIICNASSPSGVLFETTMAFVFAVSEMVSVPLMRRRRSAFGNSLVRSSGMFRSL